MGAGGSHTTHSPFPFPSCDSAIVTLDLSCLQLSDFGSLFIIKGLASYAQEA